MAKLVINEKEYDADSLSEDAKQHLQSIQFVDSELVRLNAKIAALKTARIGYGAALVKIVSGEKTDHGESDLPDTIEFT